MRRSWILGFAIDKVLSDSGKFEGYKISSKAHIQKLMENLGLTDHDVANIPLNPQLTLPRLEEPEDGVDPKACIGPNKRSYLSIIGSVLFICMVTRPDVAYACSMLARHSTRPGRDHCDQLLQLCKYLNSTQTLGITYRKQGLYPYASL